MIGFYEKEGRAEVVVDGIVVGEIRRDGDKTVFYIYRFSEFGKEELGEVLRRMDV